MKTKILVADDSLAIQKIVAMAFETEDISVEGIGDGNEAFEQLTEMNPRIVLADTDMPGLNGYQLSKKIKETDGFQSIMVLLLTSDFEEFNETLFNESQADDFIAKPFKSEDIIQKIRELLQKNPQDDTPTEPYIISLSESDIIEEDEDIPEGDPVEANTEKDVVQLSMEAVVEEEKEESTSSDTSPSEEELRTEDETEESPEEEPVESEEDSVVQDLEEQEMPEESPEEKVNTWGPINSSMDASEIPDDILSEVSGETEPDAESTMSDSVASLDDTEETVDDELADVSATEMDSIDDLDLAFRELSEMIESTSADPQEASTPQGSEDPQFEDLPDLNDVGLEPDNLLEQIAPSVFSDTNPLKPDLIKETLGFSQSDPEKPANGSKEPALDKPVSGGVPSHPETVEQKVLPQITDEHILQIVERSLNTSLKKELAGLSDSILELVKKTIGEVTPLIAREIIQEEIRKIREAEKK